jgi:hypothetical protein
MFVCCSRIQVEVPMTIRNTNFLVGFGAANMALIASHDERSDGT